MSDPFVQVPTDSRHTSVAEHVRRYAATGGQEGHLWNGAPTLLLTTTGRASHRPRRTALIYGRNDADAYLVVGSNLGADRHPDWYLNLRATPEANIQILGELLLVRARTASDAERAGLWRRMTAIWPDYDRYQQTTSRALPVVILQPS